jgi:hypothetical protein
MSNSTSDNDTVENDVWKVDPSEAQEFEESLKRDKAKKEAEQKEAEQRRQIREARIKAFKENQKLRKAAAAAADSQKEARAIPLEEAVDEMEDDIQAALLENAIANNANVNVNGNVLLNQRLAANANVGPAAPEANVPSLLQ